MHFIDVGQGDAALIACDGHYMLIDAGNNDKGTTVQSYLMSQGVEKLDYVIGTHPDADHIGGLDVVIYKFDCDTIIMPNVANDTRTYDDVVQAMKSKGYRLLIPAVGETYTLGGATFTIVAPNADYGNDMNDWSVGVLVQNGNNRFLFTGDAEEKAEEDILNNGIDISADVYAAAHHGSKTATSQAFLDKVSPAYVVISAGEGNKYGHPHAEVLNRLRQQVYLCSVPMSRVRLLQHRMEIISPGTALHQKVGKQENLPEAVIVQQIIPHQTALHHQAAVMLV